MPTPTALSSGARALQGLAPVRIAWAELRLDDHAQAKLDGALPANAPLAEELRKYGGLSEFAGLARSVDGWYDPREFDSTDWPKLAKILDGADQGLRGTYLVRKDGKTWRKEVKNTREELEKEKAKEVTAARVKGKEAPGSLFSDEEGFENGDEETLRLQLADVFKLDASAMQSLAWDLFEGTPLLGALASALKVVGLSVQTLSRIVDQIVLSGLEATSVSVIEHEALIGAYSLGKGALKRLGAELGEAVVSGVSSLVGVNVATKLTTTAVKLAVNCYLLIADEVRVFKLNRLLEGSEPSAEVWKRRLRANPEIAIYLPFLPGSGAAIVLGLLPPGSVLYNAPVNQVVQGALKKDNEVDHDVLDKLSPVDLPDAEKRAVRRLAASIARVKDRPPIWLLSRWDPVPLKEAYNGNNIDVKVAQERLYKVLRMMEKSQDDCPFALFRGSYTEYRQQKKLEKDVDKLGTPVHTIQKSTARTQGIEVLWKVFGTSKPAQQRVSASAWRDPVESFTAPAPPPPVPR